MALPINIEDLLGGLVVEGTRVEYKKGWNPDPIYRTICAFANDFEDTCGGYIVVGVEEINGMAKRPVCGIDINDIDKIEKAMVGFNNLIAPYYQPRVYFEQVDGKTIMVIWVTAGERRPYKVPDVTEDGTDNGTDKLNVTDADTERVIGDVTENVTENVTEGGTDISAAEKRRSEILRLMKLDSKITTDYLANILYVSRRTIARDIDLLRSQNKLKRDGDDFGGNWVVL